MIPEEAIFTDFFGQEIKANSKLIIPIKERLKLCRIIKFNANSLIVTEVAYEKGKQYRILPTNTIVLAGEDLTVFTLLGKV